MGQKRRTNITKIGQTVPRTFKFGLIVAVAILWADVIRALIEAVGARFFVEFSPLVVNTLVALTATIGAIAVLVGYRHLVNLLKKIKV